MVKERIEGTYIEALLRAALLLGDKHSAISVREVTVVGYKLDGEERTLYPRCKMAVQDENASTGEDYLILYPM